MNNKDAHTILIIAAGSGERFGGGLPKQYMPLLGQTVLRRSIEAFRRSGFRNIRVVIHPDHQAYYASAVAGLTLPPPVTGGGTRQESVRLGLEALAGEGQPPAYVWMHDAARPAVSPELVGTVEQALATDAAVVPGLAVTDTLRRKLPGGTRTESREGLYAMQTPQAFRFAEILALHEKYRGQPVTDDAALCELAGLPVRIVEGDARNIKITHAADLPRMEQSIAAARADIRTGKGYDVHRLVPPPADGSRPLLICGIEVPHSAVLEGHSDADVGLHAVTDALLATICDGDIGMHFSPKDDRWKGADSAVFLRHAAQLVADRGGVITHVDVTVICEAPKIGPHRDNMRTRIGEILSLPLQRVSVKATTTEGLGFTGRREGIAAEAICTVRLPFAYAETSDASSQDAKKWGT